MARPRYTSHPPVWSTRRSPFAKFPADAFLSLVREHAGQGERVRVRRDGFTYYDVMENGGAYLVMPSACDAAPIGTFGNVAAALLAGDAHVEAVRRGEFGAQDDDGGFPRGAA